MGNASRRRSPQRRDQPARRASVPAMNDPLLAPATVLRAKLLTREISSAELLTAVLARIDALNPGLNALVALDRDGASASAEASDKRIAAGEARALEGLPLSVKDAYDVAGMLSTAGAPALRERVPERDASAVARLRAAGAVIVAKSNVPTFVADFQTYNSVYGVTRHPLNPDYSPGGSSGGAAAAVATGMSALDLVSDLGGSARWPAHVCGIFGLRPTWGLASTFGHVPPPPHKPLVRDPDCLTPGVLARGPEDLAMMLNVIAGPRIGARTAPLKPARKGPLRVALWAEDAFAATSKDVSAAVREAARRLEAQGAIVDERARPNFSFAEAFEVFATLNHAVLAYGWPDKLRDRIAATAASFAPGDTSHRALQARAARISPGAYREIDWRRSALKRLWARFFEKFDVVLCPPAPVGAIRHDHQPDVHARRIDVDGVAHPYMDFLIWAALASGPGLPAAVAPVQAGADGFPRGVQIIAAEGEDLTAVAVAAMI
jgi:amidase